MPDLSYLPDRIIDRQITPMEELFCPYYFRITAMDKPGVLSTVSGILSKYGISIESVIQKGRKESGPVPIVIRTHRAQESAVEKALAEIDALEVVASETVKIRILEDQE